MAFENGGAALRATVAGLGLGVTACSGGGSGGGPPPVTLGFAAAGATVTEGASALAVQIVLHTSLAELDAPVSVTVSDRGTGSASSGSDYSAFAPVVVTFPIGAVDGDTAAVNLTALGDHVVEGVSETVALGLSAASGAALSGLKTFTATITDADEASVQFVTSASSTVDESVGTVAVLAVLDLPPGVSLGTAASVRAADLGGGTATPGADYATFAPRTVTFAAGSLDGATQSILVDVLDDETVEADETLRLGLSTPSAGTRVGTTGLHVLTIRDDDAGGAAAFLATEGPTGQESTLAYDAQVDLGSEVVGDGPNGGTLVRVSNVGGAAMHVGAPRLTGANSEDFSVTVESAPLVPAADVTTGGDPALAAVSPLEALEAQAGPGVALAYDASTLAALAPLERASLVGFPLPDVGPVTLELQRMPLPITSDAVLRVDGVPVAGGPRALLGDLTLWTGNVLEVPGSRLFLALTDAGPQGFVELPGRADPLVHLTRDADGTLRAVRSAELAALGFEPGAFVCQDAPPVPGALAPDTSGDAPPTTEALDVADCRLAIETDWQLYQKFGSTGGLTSYVTQLIAAVSAQYFEDVQATLSIAYLGVYTSAADPWTSQDSGGNASALLNEFVGAWAPSSWPASANLAHFISGASLGGGVAYVNVLCNQGYGFGVSGNVNGNINWGTWTGQPGSFTWDFVVVAHELGHNFGSSHTHAYCPPLDQCYSNCTGTTTCSQGTIMSYCHTCGGMDNIDLHFHPVTANIMRQAVNSSCLDLSALAAGDHVQYSVRFDPRSTTGARTATLELPHDAPNATQPFRVQLTGTAQ